MTKFALVIAGVFQEVRDYATQPPDIPHKQVVWLPFVSTVDTYDPETETLEPAVITVGVTQVTSHAAKRLLTALELDAIKDARIADIQRATFEAIFNHENRIRALESKAPITKQQLLAALKALL